ncbi:NinX [Vibrio phage 1.266.O._10N.286.52.F9]|nr:NinX [Vibrio phage 1.266.O._10N.286.52.F9]
MNYEEMSDFEINKKVAMELGVTCFVRSLIDENAVMVDKGGRVQFDPCNNPSDAWPIIANNKIALTPVGQLAWLSYGWAKWTFNHGFSPRKEVIGQSPLRAAMICFLKLKDAEK